LSFFFSSRRRHTRFSRDWSSDVCSSDLEFKDVHLLAVNVHGPGMFHTANKPIKSITDLRGMKLRGPTRQVTKLLASLGATPVGRSEERRVGKECRARRGPWK